MPLLLILKPLKGLVPYWAYCGKVSSMSDKEIKENKRIRIAGMGRRLLAFLFDIAIVAILSAVLWTTVGGNYLLKAFGTQEVVQEELVFVADSGLISYSTDEEGYITNAAFYTGEYAYDSGMNYKKSDTSSTNDEQKEELGYGAILYLDMCWDSFTGFFHDDTRVESTVTVSENGEDVTYSQSEYYTPLNFGVKLLGLPDPSLITLADIQEKGEDALDDESHFFKWVLGNDGLPDVSQKPIVTEKAFPNGKPYSEEILSQMKAVFLVEGNSYSGIYYDMYTNIIGQEYYATRNNTYNLHNWLSLAVFYLPLSFIFFFLIPICFKDGQTLGKKLLGICLIGKNGYAINWVEHILHPLVVTIIVCTSVMIPWNYMMPYIGILMFMVLCIICYMFGFLSKGTNKMLDDRIAGTYVIDAKSSIWFASKEVEEEYESSHSTLRPKSGFFDEISPEENAHYALMDSILDLSTIDKNRKEAAAITSFDEFESQGVEVKEGLLEETEKQAEEAKKKHSKGQGE